MDFYIVWVDVVTCGLVMLGKGRILGDWCSLIRGQEKGPGGLANETIKRRVKEAIAIKQKTLPEKI